MQERKTSIQRPDCLVDSYRNPSVVIAKGEAIKELVKYLVVLLCNLVAAFFAEASLEEKGSIHCG